MNKVVVLSLLSLLFIFSACNKDVDVTRPIISIEKIQSPTIAFDVCGQRESDVIELMGGEHLNMTVLFEDNEQLSQYKLDIHQNFDCHGHGSGTFPNITLPDIMGSTEDWKVLEIVELSGKTQRIEISLEVPINVTAGNYHFTIQALDLLGNEAENIQIFSVCVLNPHDTIAPVITVHQPTLQTVQIKRGEILHFSGNVTDDQPLEQGGQGVVFLSYSNTSGSNSFSTDAYKVFESNTGNSVDFELSYEIPTFLTTGNYLFYLIATDGVRNVSDTKIFNVDIN